MSSPNLSVFEGLIMPGLVSNAGGVKDTIEPFNKTSRIKIFTRC